ncbi:hypothetical protein M422DRAFT_253812 [Sphaerobolus stellatus SS14]|uniref:Integral membrane protein n=1 Tax=Sphaerobolus stellatus (strain SS14) TaxID=990650 RepID=A0A0C9VMF9_SPHS4|nr:hypothetical protein M422DRAFT_253812 [Sphaerobolus stellatus SS14]
MALTHAVCSGNKSGSLKDKYGLLSILLTLYGFATIHCALTWWYFTQRFTIGGMFSNFIGEFLNAEPTFFITLGSLAVLINAVIADSISCWRCWILTGKRTWIIILPACAIVASGVFGLLATWAHITEHTTEKPGHVAVRFASFDTPFQCLSLGSSLYTTSIIIGWLLSSYRSLQGDLSVFGTRGVIIRTIEIIAESQLIYSIIQVVSLALVLQHNEAFTYAENIFAQITGIAPTLIILRVSAGYTIPSTFNPGSKLARSLRFGGNTVSRSDMESQSASVLNNTPNLESENSIPTGP